MVTPRGISHNSRLRPPFCSSKKRFLLFIYTWIRYILNTRRRKWEYNYMINYTYQTSSVARWKANNEIEPTNPPSSF